jgi:tRNA pseudouridine38-40 synthase
LKIALGITYDGSNFCGWQSQPQKCGVQDALEFAIAQIAQHEIKVHAAGRTDAGVHGLGQVVHFVTNAHRPVTAWVRGVNAHLPDTVRVEWAHKVDDDFHARFSARSRSYLYLLYNADVAPALMATKAGWFHLPLDYDAMSVAAKYLIGEHDFSGFRASECQAKSAVRTITKADVRMAGKYFVFEFTANAFLQHQVRNMIGALVYIGKGVHSPSYINELLQKRDRTLSPPTFSPNGLYLINVGYESKWGLPTNSQSGIQVFI